MPTLTSEQAQSMTRTKARRKLRTDINVALAGLDRAMDHAPPAELSARLGQRLARIRTDTEALLQDLPNR